MSYSSDDLLLARVRAATTVSTLLQELQQWYSWGEFDTTGAVILTRLGEIGYGNPEAIAALERSAKGNIARTSAAASNALSGLAERGDFLAVIALERVHSYWREQERLRREEAQRRAVEQEEREAEQLGITIDELRQRKKLAAAAHTARVVDYQGKQQYGESRFHPGQSVICLIENWKYTGQIGTVERAINSKFVAVRFDDNYLTIQGDDKFRLIDMPGSSP